ncbi:hypothetical protein IWZ01DRAFT_559713 [Phyllosticta capitalensis]
MTPQNEGFLELTSPNKRAMRDQLDEEEHPAKRQKKPENENSSTQDTRMFASEECAVLMFRIYQATQDARSKGVAAPELRGAFETFREKFPAALAVVQHGSRLTYPDLFGSIEGGDSASLDTETPQAAAAVTDGKIMNDGSAAEIRKMQEQIKSLQEESKQKSEEVEKSQEKVGELQTREARLMEAAAATNQTLKETKGALDHADETIDQLKSDVKSLRTQLSVSQRDVRSLQTRNTDLDRQLTTSDNELRLARKELAIKIHLLSAETVVSDSLRVQVAANAKKLKNEAAENEKLRKKLVTEANAVFQLKTKKGKERGILPQTEDDDKVPLIRRKRGRPLKGEPRS